MMSKKLSGHQVGQQNVTADGACVEGALHLNVAGSIAQVAFYLNADPRGAQNAFEKIPVVQHRGRTLK
jgi:hypothetical protein